MQVYSQDIKDKVRLLRIAGLSLGEIQKKTNVPRTTIRGWISNSPLTPEQKAIINQRVLKGLQEGRVEAQRVQREKKLETERTLLSKGIQEIGTMNTRDLFIAGIALYWAEGFKNRHEHRLGFCNSDPIMVRFYILWLQKCLNIDKRNLIARLTLNKSYEEKTKEIEAYWLGITSIPISQFTKPFYQNTQWKKQYNTDNYHGVLRIHVKESLRDLLKMRGWIEGLKQNLAG